VAGFGLLPNFTFWSPPGDMLKWCSAEVDHRPVGRCPARVAGARLSLSRTARVRPITTIMFPWEASGP